MIAALRVLWAVTKRELKGLSSVGLNNLLFCVVFVMQGSTRRGAFLGTLLFQILLFVPLLFAMSADALERVPRERERLWPLAAWQRVCLRLAGVGLNPAFWVLGVAVAVWGGVWAGVGFVAVAVVIQLLVGLVSLVRGGGAGSLAPARWLPRFPGRLGGLVQVELRHIFRTLDFYAALLLCMMGGAYRAFSKGPQVEAFPILAILVAIALSTYAQRSFGLDGAAGIARYRLLPLAGWRLLLAKDAAYLGVVGLLVLPLGFVPGMTFSLMAVAIGRYPAVRMPVKQRAWRFTGGDLRFGLAQLFVGGLMGMGGAQIGAVFLAVAAAVYGSSVLLGGRWWDRG